MIDALRNIISRGETIRFHHSSIRIALQTHGLAIFGMIHFVD